MRRVLHLYICLLATIALSHSTHAQFTIVDSFEIPEGASGLAFDGTYLYCGIYGANGAQVYKINPETGNYTLKFTGEHEDAFGLTYDGKYLWTTDHTGSSSTPAKALQLDWNGNVIQEIELPDHYMSGIAFDDGDFWVARYYEDPGHLYKVSPDGTVLASFDFQDDQPWDIALQDDNLWVADYWGDALYLIDQNGSLIESHDTVGIDPAGVVWDGTHLWYCDNGENYDVDRLYKVALEGDGTPEMHIPVSEHDFGIVPIGESETWEVHIKNMGDAPLDVYDISFGMTTEFYCDMMFPLTLKPNSSIYVPIVYEPISPYPAEIEALVVTNDPVNQTATLFLSGHGVYADPVIQLSQDEHHFGSVRLGSLSQVFVDISNIGGETLYIYPSDFDNPNFYIEESKTQPIVIEPLETYPFGIWFHAQSTDMAYGIISLVTNAPSGVHYIDVTGQGVEMSLPMGDSVWSSQFTGNWDNSFKAIAHIDDLNGDDKSDVIGCSEDNYIRAFNGNANESGNILWEHEIYSGNVYSRKGLAIVSDVNDDGYQDVCVGVTGGARLVRMLSGKTGEELWSYHTDSVGDGGWVYQVDGTRDFNGDGIIDVLACAGDDGKDAGPKRAYLFDGIDGELIWQRPTGGAVFSIIAVDDFTGDGVPDAVCGTTNQWETEGRAVGINGATGAQAWSIDTNGSSVWGLAPLGDVNDDGINDVIVGDFYGDWHILNAVNGSELHNGQLNSLITNFTVIDDVNGDGYYDIVPNHFNSFVRAMSGFDGSTIWSMPVIDSPTVANAIPDLNGNGVDDLVVGTLFSDNYIYFIEGEDGAILYSANFDTPVDAIASMPDVTGDGSWEMVAGGRDGTIECVSGGLQAVACPADVNNDGVVGVTDILMVIDRWGDTDSIADVNNDGVVNVGDVLMIVSDWGACH